MRDVLFRGKDIAGNWHYGVPLVFGERYVCMTAPHTYDKKVIPETVGQFTGLTDKNGEKIFEGDIVKIYWKDNVLTKGDIKYDEKLCRFVVYEDFAYPYGFDNTTPFEVIGNVHDNNLRWTNDI